MDRDEWVELKSQMLNTTVYLSDFAGKNSEIELLISEDMIYEETSIKSIESFHKLYGFSSKDVDIINAWHWREEEEEEE